MTTTIAAVMRECRNFFERSAIEGEISISGGVVSPEVDAPYVYIKGSAVHDGLWQTDGTALVGSQTDEDFSGTVWLLYPPREFLALCEQVKGFEAAAAPGPYTSERLNEYSYTRAQAANGAPMTWETAFSQRLIPYRRMFTGVG